MVYSVTSNGGPSMLSVIMDPMTTTTASRSWNIRIYQYDCNSPSLGTTAFHNKMPDAISYCNRFQLQWVACSTSRALPVTSAASTTDRRCVRATCQITWPTRTTPFACGWRTATVASDMHSLPPIHTPSVSPETRHQVRAISPSISLRVFRKALQSLIITHCDDDDRNALIFWQCSLCRS